MPTTIATTRLSNIATRQTQSRLRDAFFAACIVLATAVSIVSVSTASHAAQPADVASASATQR
jgi:hypothetical protein